MCSIPERDKYEQDWPFQSIKYKSHISLLYSIIHKPRTTLDQLTNTPVYCYADPYTKLETVVFDGVSFVCKFNTITVHLK